jgi:hypothetical protein
MYKAVQCRQEHTGGGDGDKESNDEDEDDEGDAGDDATVVAEKRKKPVKSRKARFSKKTLDAFEESPYYAMIDDV